MGFGIRMKQGVLTDILSFMRLAGEELTEMQKCVVLQYDEMSLKSVLEFDNAEDEIVDPYNYMQNTSEVLNLVFLEINLEVPKLPDLQLFRAQDFGNSKFSEDIASLVRFTSSIPCRSVNDPFGKTNVHKNERVEVNGSEVTPDKIRVIEDWLLGVEPKCLYTAKEGQKNSSSGKNENHQLSNDHIPCEHEDKSLEKTGKLNELSSSTQYIRDSISTISETDDSLADPDYSPYSPKQLQLGNLNCSSHLNSEISMESTEIPIATKIALELEDESPQISKVIVLNKWWRQFQKKIIVTEKIFAFSVKRMFLISQGICQIGMHKNSKCKKILSFKKKSLNRKQALPVLRKRGNFVRNRSDTILRPVKRLQTKQKLTSPDSFLPCKYYLGFYNKNSLFRHTKTIFHRMRADDVGLVAKKDPLICRYAYSYIKGQHSKGNLDLVRQNMRRLAKLLQFANKENHEIKQLVDILHPYHFQLIIAGVSKMAQYNSKTETYESPTLAIHFGTLIKKCCDLAYVDFLQKDDTNDQRKDLKILKRLIESQWADEISAQASANLNQNKWNKDELLPLTSDLKKLNIFLQKSAAESFDNLKNNERDTQAYNTLKDVLYTQIILLNRRRPAEVAQLKVHTFKSLNLENNQTNEFEKRGTQVAPTPSQQHQQPILPRSQEQPQPSPSHNLAQHPVAPRNKYHLRS
ncbi:hypothetical protein JTB14_034283 [Gonioctena quinquepunctata]|nr:hypothetical protein JTB14_034283 [Gonioctena quinquepunctata]